MKHVHSTVLGVTGLMLAVACGSNDRSGFDQNQDPSNPNNGGSSGGGFNGASAIGYLLAPKNATAIIDTATNPATPGAVTFKVIHQTTAGDEDVTAGATFTLKDGSLGTMSGATFTSIPALPDGVLGKSTMISGATKDGQAVGTLTVVQLRKTGDQRDFFFVVPYQEAPSPASDTLKFSTNIKQADVAFVMDTTGSMGGSIDNLKNALNTTLMAQLQAAIPNVGLAVVDHKDFGQFDPWGVLVRQVVTTNLASAKAAVSAMSATGGGDEPEAQIGAMHHTLTGAPNSGSPALGAHTPAAGTFGGVNFRPGSVPVVVEITDATWKNPSGSVDMAGLKAAFTTAKAKFVNVTSYDESQANDLSDATGSHVPPAAFGSIPGCAAGQCCTGVNGAGRGPTGPGGTCRLNFMHSGGSGVSNGIVNAIKAIAIGTVFDVKAIASNDPKNAKGVDATKFIKALRAMDEGNASLGCPVAATSDSDGDGVNDTFLGVTAGTPVCFEVIPAVNTTVPPEVDPQFYNAFIDVIGVQGNLNLDRRSVLFLVPPKAVVVN